MPVEGLGVQSHLRGTPSGAVLLKRLDMMAAVGLPIWITELDFSSDNDSLRASVIKDALLAYFRYECLFSLQCWSR